MRSPIRVVTAFVRGPLRRGTTQIAMSVTVGVCVALATQTLVPERRAPATTDVQRQAAETVVPRDDRVPKAAIAAPIAATEATEPASAQRTELAAAETHVAKLPAVEPRADRAPVQVEGPYPYTPPTVSIETAPAASIAGYEPPASVDAAPTAGVDVALRPPADIGVPGQPMVLSGAAENFAADEFDPGTSAPQAERRVPLLALPFTAVEQGVFKLGDVVASIGKPGY